MVHSPVVALSNGCAMSLADPPTSVEWPWQPTKFKGVLSVFKRSCRIADGWADDGGVCESRTGTLALDGALPCPLIEYRSCLSG